MEAIYCKLPPPKPSLTPRTGPIISMGVYHCSSNPCFDGESTVLMSDFFLKKVKVSLCLPYVYCINGLC